MRQAIVTKYHGPTNTRGSKVSATAAAGRVYVAWKHSLGIERNHAAAAKALAVKMGWNGEWIGGGLPGSGFVFVAAIRDAEADRDGFTLAMAER